MYTRSSSPSCSVSQSLLRHPKTSLLRSRGLWLGVAVAFGMPVCHAAADEALPIAEIKHEGQVDFEKEILPLLRRNCVACHNATEAESELVLETPESILKGGIEGPGVVPGNADESLVFQLASHQRESFMPPEDNDVGAKDFTPEELGLFKLWINQGAKGSLAGSGQAIAWQPLPEGVNPIYAVAVTPHGRFAAAGRANQISLYSVLAQQELGRLTDPELIEVGLYDKPGVAHRDAVQSLAFSPNGRQLASGGFRTVKIWNRNDSLRHAELTAANADIRALAVSADGQRAAVAQADGKVQIYEVASGKIVHSLAASTGALSSVAFSPDASRLVGGAIDGTVTVWNLQDGVQLGSLHSPGPLNAVAVVNEGRQIVTGGADGIIRLWDMPATSAAAQPVREMPGHTGPVTAFAPVPTQPHVFVSASFDGTARQWDANGGKEIRQFAHGIPICAVAVRPDGKRIATAANIGTTKLWNAEDGKQIVELTTDNETAFLLADLQMEIELAGRHVQNAKTDLDAGIARQAAEAANADKSAVDLVRAELTAKQKADAAAKATADKAAAEKELADLQKQLETAKAPAPAPATEAAPAPATEAAPAPAPAAEAAPAPAAEPAAAEAAPAPAPTAEELKQQTEKLIAELTEKIKVAEKKVADLTAPAQKAMEEQQAAADAAETAKRSVETAKEAVARTTAEVPRLKEVLAARQQEQQAATDRLAQTQQDINSLKVRITELVNQKVEADRAALATTAQLRTAEAARQAAATALAAAHQNALATLRAQVQAAAAADALQPAPAPAAAADPAAVDPAAADPAAAEKAAADKAAAEKAATEKLAAATAAKAQATAAHTAAQTALQQASAQLEAAVIALGGKQSLAETAAAISAELEKQLAAAKAAVAATEDAGAKAAESAVVEYLTAQQAEVSRRAAEAAEQAKAAAAPQVEAARVFGEARAALVAAAANAQKVSDEAQRTARAATVAKTAADLAATEADALNKASTTQKEAAAAALKTAQDALTKAADDAAKAVAAAELENATRNQVAADARAAEAATALQAATEAKAAAEKAVADNQAQSKQLQEAANQALAAAKAASADARNKLAAADTAAGGAKAAVATASDVTATAAAALAELRRPVRSVAFSPNGTQLAVAGDAGRVDFYSSEAGAALHQLNSAGDTPAADAASGADFVGAAYVGAERLLTAAEDRALAVWASLPVWSLQRKIGSVASPTPFVNRVTALDFSPNGELLATGGGEPSRSGELQIWNAATGELVRQIPDAHSDTVFSVAFSDDGKYLASCGADRFMKVFETATGEFVKSFEGHTHHVLGVSWRADGRMLATSGADNVIKVWDFNTGEGIRTIPGFKKELTAIDFLGASDNFVVTTGDNQVLTRNTGGGAGPTFPGATDFMYNLRTTQDGKLVVAGGHDSVLRVWDQAGKSIVTFAPTK